MTAFAAIRHLRGLRPPARLVLYSLAGHANEIGLAWPSVATIAAENDITERAVYKSIHDLEAAALIVRRSRPNHAGNLYDLRGLSARSKTLNRVQMGDGLSMTVVQVEGEPSSGGDEPGSPDQIREEIKEEKRASGRARGGVKRLGPEDMPSEAVAAFLTRLAHNYRPAPEKVSKGPSWRRAKR